MEDEGVNMELLDVSEVKMTGSQFNHIQVQLKRTKVLQKVLEESGKVIVVQDYAFNASDVTQHLDIVTKDEAVNHITNRYKYKLEKLTNKIKLLEEDKKALNKKYEKLKDRHDTAHYIIDRVKNKFFIFSSGKVFVNKVLDKLGISWEKE